MKSEDTIFNPIPENIEPQASTDLTTGTVASPAKGNPAFVQIGAAGVSGLVIGAVGMTLTSAAIVPEDSAEDQIDGIEFDDEEEEPLDERGSHRLHLTDGEIDFATGVNDDMSFGEAFAAARAEVGPGGAFVWHGEVYGTFTQAEWNSMSEEERAEWASHFDYDNIDTTHGGNTDGQGGHETETHLPTNGEDVPIGRNEEQSGQDTPEHEIEVHAIVQDAETGQSYVAMTIDGHEAYYIDQDGDGVFDYLVQDLNDNQELDSGEAFDISAEGLTVEQVSELTGIEVVVVNESEVEPDIETEDPDQVEIDTPDDDVDEDLDITDEEALDI